MRCARDVHSVYLQAQTHATDFDDCFHNTRTQGALASIGIMAAVPAYTTTPAAAATAASTTTTTTTYDLPDANN